MRMILKEDEVKLAVAQYMIARLDGDTDLDLDSLRLLAHKEQGVDKYFFTAEVEVRVPEIKDVADGTTED